MSCELIMTVEEMQDRESWKALRREGLGGSDAAVVVGLSKWKSPWELWLEKTGQVEEEEEEQSEEVKERLYWGTKQEDLIANWFTEKTGMKLRRCGVLRSKEYPFMLASIDRQVVGYNEIVEIKTTSAYNMEEWKDDKVPPQYMCQGLHYLSVSGADRCHFVCLVGGNTPIIRTMERDDYEIEALIEAEKYFWEHYVIAKELPPTDGSASCSEAVAKHFSTDDNEEAAELTGDMDIICRDLAILKEDRKRLDLLIAEKENKLKVAMGNHAFGRSPLYNLWYKVTSRNSFDAKALEKAYPEIYKQFQKQSTFRTLRVRESKARMGD